MQNLIKNALLTLLKGYKYIISPLLPATTCRFYPTCSSYARGAIENHGIFKGSLLAAWRLMRCGPWTKGGIDPVPENSKQHKEGEHVTCNH